MSDPQTVGKHKSERVGGALPPFGQGARDNHFCASEA